LLVFGQQVDPALAWSLGLFSASNEVVLKDKMSIYVGYEVFRLRGKTPETPRSLMLMKKSSDNVGIPSRKKVCIIVS